jgi:endonuclease G
VAFFESVGGVAFSGEFFSRHVFSSRSSFMNDPFQMQRELRYGAPVCDQILTGRYFTIGYSWYFRQAKWTLEIVRRDNDILPYRLERLDNFRADMRIPQRFRAALKGYKDSGYDRGHLAASANHAGQEIQNSETYLLSNMSPQVPEFNQGKWRELEDAIRQLDDRKDGKGRNSYLETFVLTCPVFYFERVIETIGDKDDKFGIDIPVPHAFVKSVLAEDRRGGLWLWTFLMENKKLDGDLGSYLVKTYDAEQLVGGRFWDRLSGNDLHGKKGDKLDKMWDLTA